MSFFNAKKKQSLEITLHKTKYQKEKEKTRKKMCKNDKMKPRRYQAIKQAMRREKDTIVLENVTNKKTTERVKWNRMTYSKMERKNSREAHTKEEL